MRKSSMSCMSLPMMPLMMMARMGRAAWSCDRGGVQSDATPSGGFRAWQWQAWQGEVRAEPKPAPLKNVVETARAAGAFKTLLEALNATKLDEALAGAGPFTVFAPDDAAFQKLPAGALDGLLKRPEELAKVLKLHVVAARLTSKELPAVGTLKTLAGQSLTVDTAEGVKVGSVRVTRPDIACGNGVIHVIDGVLLPS